MDKGSRNASPVELPLWTPGVPHPRALRIVLRVLQRHPARGTGCWEVCPPPALLPVEGGPVLQVPPFCPVLCFHSLQGRAAKSGEVAGNMSRALRGYGATLSYVTNTS